MEQLERSKFLFGTSVSTNSHWVLFTVSFCLFDITTSSFKTHSLRPGGGGACL